MILEYGTYGVYFNIKSNPMFWAVHDDFGNLVDIRGKMWGQLAHFALYSERN